MSFSEVFAAGGLFGVVLVFFIAPAAYKVVTGFMRVWEKKKSIELDQTLFEINKKKLDASQVFEHTKQERDSYSELAKERWKIIENKELEIKNYGVQLEEANARARRLEGDLQQASDWSKDLVSALIYRYERRIKRYRKFIRPQGKVRTNAPSE